MGMDVVDKPPVEVVGAVLIDRGKILLGLRAPHRRSCASCWDVIGGHVESGESLLDALMREVEEEIGVSPLHAISIKTFAFDDAVDGRTLLHLFLVDRWNGSPSLADDEHVELRWFAIDEAARLPNLAVADYRILFSSLPFPDPS